MLYRLSLSIFLAVLSLSYLHTLTMAHVHQTGCHSVIGWTRLSSPLSNVTVNDTLFIGLRSIAAGWSSIEELYAATLAGPYYSDDCGITWAKIPFTVDRRTPRGVSGSIYDVAVDRASTVWVAPELPEPILRTFNRGEWWQGSVVVDDESGGVLGSAGARRVVLSSARPGLLYAALVSQGRGGEGLGRSLDGGQTWTVIQPSVNSPFALDPTDATIVYRASSTDGRHLEVSTDGGLTFAGQLHFIDDRTSDNGLALDDRITALAVSMDRSRIWVATVRGSLMVSNDRGQTWVDLVSPVPTTPFIRFSASPIDARLLFAVSTAGELWAYRDPGPQAAPTQIP